VDVVVDVAVAVDGFVLDEEDGLEVVTGLELVLMAEVGVVSLLVAAGGMACSLAMKPVQWQWVVGQDWKVWSL
jgi:hypothetical protein